MIGQQVYGPMSERTRKVFMKIDERIGATELKREFDSRFKGYSEHVMRVLGGVTLVSALLMLITGVYLIMNHSSMQAGAAIFAWSIPFIDYAESLFYWAANFLLLFSAFVMIRGAFYAIYKSHGKGLWFATLGMFSLPFLSILVMGAYINNPTCAHLLGVILNLLGMHLQTGISMPSFYLQCMIAFAVSYIAFLSVYLYFIKKHGQLPVPKYGLQIKERAAAKNYHIGAYTLYGSALIAYALLGVLSLASLALHGINGAYNTNTLIALWMVYPVITMKQHFGDIGVLVSLAIPFVYLSSISFLDANLFTSWKRRKWIVVPGIFLMIVYAALGFMAMTPDQFAGSAAMATMHSAPAFTYAEFPWIIASIVISAFAGAYLLKKSRED